jgi:hypothetical protein
VNVNQPENVVKLNGAAISSYPSTFTFDNDTVVTLEAVPAPGYEFDNWGGDLSNDMNPLSMTINCNRNVIANFISNETVTANFSQQGSSWWLFGAIPAGLVAAGMIIWFRVKARKP